jgi:hypothetical protein
MGDCLSKNLFKATDWCHDERGFGLQAREWAGIK